MEINKIYARDHFDDDNQGYIYGIEWDINCDVDNPEWHLQWFEFEVIRDQEYNHMQFIENTLIGQLIASISYFFKYKLKGRIIS